MTTFAEIIAKLPAELRPTAERYLPHMERMFLEDAQQFLALAANGDTSAWHKSLLARMTTDQVVAEMGLLAEEFKRLSEERKAAYRDQVAFVNGAINLALGLLMGRMRVA